MTRQGKYAGAARCDWPEVVEPRPTYENSLMMVRRQHGAGNEVVLHRFKSQKERAHKKGQVNPVLGTFDWPGLGGSCLLLFGLADGPANSKRLQVAQPLEKICTE